MLEHRTIINKGGRVVIPALIRKKLHLEQGDELIVKMDDYGIYLFSLNSAINSAQAIVEQYNHNHKNLTEILAEVRSEEQDV